MLERVKIIVDGEVVKVRITEDYVTVLETIWIKDIQIFLKYDQLGLRAEVVHFEDKFNLLAKTTRLEQLFRDPCNPSQQEKDMLEMLHGIVIPWNKIEIKIDKYENPY